MSPPPPLERAKGNFALCVVVARTKTTHGRARRGGKRAAQSTQAGERFQRRSADFWARSATLKRTALQRKRTCALQPLAALAAAAVGAERLLRWLCCRRFWAAYRGKSARARSEMSGRECASSARLSRSTSKRLCVCCCCFGGQTRVTRALQTNTDRRTDGRTHTSSGPMLARSN